MKALRRTCFVVPIAGAVLLVLSVPAAAKTLCVRPSGAGGCFKTISAAVAAASQNDTIKVGPGTYKEGVTIGIPLSLIGAGAEASTIDATGLSNGVFVDGFDHAGLHNVTVAGFTIENALNEGVLVVNASDVTIRDNHIIDNDKNPGLLFTGEPHGCPGQPAFETDETGDCGGAIHLIGTANSIVSRNLVKGNADGLLISDETAESHDNLVIHNTFLNNPLECGIVLASHGPLGSTPPHFAPHFGVDHNTVAENVSTANGVQIGGSGVGLFSDGNGPGRVSNNVVIHNKLTGNGLGGVALHTHVGPAFGAPADNMDGNQIIGNFIAGNLADQFDTATPGRVGININSGGGGSPVLGTIISYNVIRDEDVDIAINTPAEVDIHLNDLLGEKIGVANVCAFDKATICTGSIDATENFWGCHAGPGGKECSTASGADIRFTPWLEEPVGNDDDRDRGDHDAFNFDSADAWQAALLITAKRSWVG
jgi:parallel beta-helix repeat protein